MTIKVLNLFCREDFFFPLSLSLCLQRIGCFVATEGRINITPSRFITEQPRTDFTRTRRALFTGCHCRTEVSALFTEDKYCTENTSTRSELVFAFGKYRYLRRRVDSSRVQHFKFYESINKNIVVYAEHTCVDVYTVFRSVGSRRNRFLTTGVKVNFTETNEYRAFFMNPIISSVHNHSDGTRKIRFPSTAVFVPGFLSTLVVNTNFNFNVCFRKEITTFTVYFSSRQRRVFC